MVTQLLLLLMKSAEAWVKILNQKASGHMDDEKDGAKLTKNQMNFWSTMSKMSLNHKE